MILRIARDLAGRFEVTRLSTKVLIISIFSTLVPLVVLTGLFNQANTDNGRRLLQASLQQQSSEQASEIATRLQAWQLVGDQLASDPAVLAYASSGQGQAQALAVLNRGRLSSPDFLAAGIVDGAGRVTLSTDRALTAGTLPPAALAGQGGITDPVVRGRLGGISVYHAPLIASGRFAGRLLVELDASGIIGFANPTRLPSDRFGMLIDDRGAVIGYNGPASAQVLGHVVGGGGAGGLNMPGLREALAPAANQGTGQFHFPPTDRAVEAGFTGMTARPWHVAVMQDELAFLAPLQTSTFNTVLFFLATVVPIAGLLYLVTRYLERTERQSLHDDLTGLPNRRFFRDLLDREFRAARRLGRPLSVINLDLDRFKRINDMHGHGVGDEVLKSFAGLLSRQVRSIDLAVRYGGEEFAVLLPDTGKEGAAMAAEKVRLAVEDLQIGRRATSGEQPLVSAVNLTVSAGVASFPDDGDDPESILRRADQAMYLAKSLGRNQVISFGSAEPLAKLRDDSERLHSVVRTANRATVEALSAAIDARDTHTIGHSQRVGEIAELIGDEMGLTTAELEVLALGALLHDVGRIAISDSLVTKAQGLSDDERRAMEAHTTAGYRMVSKVPFLQPAAPIILHHHENFDGSGYPNGIASQEIPLAARIVKVADAFEAMTASRAYREARPVEWALGELRRHAGGQFDPSVVQALVSVNARQRLRPLMPEVQAG